MDAVKEAGFSCLNISSTTCCELMAAAPSETKRFKAELRQRGLAVDWTHAPFYKPVLYSKDSEVYAMSMGAIKSAIAIASELESETIIVHAYDPDFPKDIVNDASINQLIDAYSNLAAFAQPYGVRVAIENLEEPYSQQLLDSLLEHVKDLTFCFDIGHANVGKTMTYYLPKYMNRLSALHIHDNHGETDEHLIPGEGEIDIAGFFKLLKDHRYEGYTGIEVHGVDKAGTDSPLKTAMLIREQMDLLVTKAATS